MNQKYLFENEKPFTPERPKPSWEQHLLGLLASLLCLAGAFDVLWSTGNVLVFLLLIGVATGQVPLWRALKRLGLLEGPAKPNEEETSEEETKEEEL